MSDDRIVVPDGMWRAFRGRYVSLPLTPETFEQQQLAALEAALRWLDGRLEEMCHSNTYRGRLSSHAAMVEVWREGIGEVRRMFIAPEPEVPEEIKDLQYEWLCNVQQACIDAINGRIQEAYRRGKESK